MTRTRETQTDQGRENRGRPSKEYKLMIQNKNHDTGQNFDEHQPEQENSMQEEDSSDELENPGEEYAQIAEISVKEALSTPDAKDWKEAIACEFKPLLKSKTWILTEKPTNKHVVGCRLILKEKYNADGSLERQKAQLVA